MNLLEEAIAIGRNTGMAFVGPFYLGCLALATDDAERREAALAEGEALIAAGTLSDNHLWFHANGVETAVEWGEWDRAERYAAALEAYTRAEPLPWAEFLIARARAIAAHGRGHRDPGLAAELERLRTWAARVGQRLSLPRIEAALAESAAAAGYSGRQAS